MFGKKRRMHEISILIAMGIVAWNNGLFSKVLGIINRVAFNFLKITNIKVGISAVVAIALFIIFGKIWNQIKQIRLSKKTQKAIATLTPSADRDDYIIERDDYRRGNPKESYYRKTFFLYLLEAFGNSCAKCGNKENGMDIDHFIFSKNEGGCFIMKHRGGYLVNNAVPLCQTCNRSKSDDDYKTFFSESELLVILEKNVTMTDLLNKRSIFSDEGKLIRHKQIFTA